MCWRPIFIVAVPPPSIHILISKWPFHRWACGDMEQELLWATSTYVILAHVPRDGVFSTALVRGSTKPIRNSLFALCPSWTATKSGLTLKNCSNQTADRVGYSINSSAGDRYNFAIGGELVEVQSFVSSQLKIELSSNESRFGATGRPHHNSPPAAVEAGRPASSHDDCLRRGCGAYPGSFHRYQSRR
ncbi:hypothetical protein ABIF65_010242 [Bradyrhizobium japonicum]|jgi:hypothetical protein|uniref:Uncharacterized protein n=3 Tax=Bradyrhizobium TaxID=374 RepID=A0ABV4FU75_9BRAD|nr:hypothetical protein [Bradyrhizobium japonicum]MCS3899739.1 hypothetical protein [Bradyrhizobium japonicum USDA 38]MCS3933378.1 hypothetical protein [Bradyrhizobium elkanii]TWI61357.1 hypothetical protein IQ16_07045 [Bradyrhizobium huanghuaihaiense]MBP1089602.1 hypothetical protein [Bradyrhizobium japonicum]